jgi:hypothetical protein
VDPAIAHGVVRGEFFRGFHCGRGDGCGAG